MTAGLRLGAPGIYIAPVRDAEDELQPVRLDVTGFVGVSLRGPVDLPVPVASWTDFVARFGGIINPTDIAPADPQGRPGPGLLPYAVQAFFAQGGVKAWVSRVGPVAPDPSATAQFRVGGTSATLHAASEGSWGRLLDVAFEFDVMQSFRRASAVPAVVAPGELALPDGLALPAARCCGYADRSGLRPGRCTGSLRCHCGRLPAAVRCWSQCWNHRCRMTRPPMRSASSPGRWW